MGRWPNAQAYRSEKCEMGRVFSVVGREHAVKKPMERAWGVPARDCRGGTRDTKCPVLRVVASPRGASGVRRTAGRDRSGHRAKKGNGSFTQTSTQIDNF